MGALRNFYLVGIVYLYVQNFPLAQPWQTTVSQDNNEEQTGSELVIQA